jgi:hypothetical protein
MHSLRFQADDPSYSYHTRKSLKLKTEEIWQMHFSVLSSVLGFASPLHMIEQSKALNKLDIS